MREDRAMMRELLGGIRDEFRTAIQLLTAQQGPVYVVPESQPSDVYVVPEPELSDFIVHEQEEEDLD